MPTRTVFLNGTESGPKEDLFFTTEEDFQYNLKQLKKEFPKVKVKS